jgi:hypothetical protein
MPPAKKNLSRPQAGALADYWCAGCHAQTKGLPRGVYCPEIGGRPPKRPAAPGACDDLDDEAT